jgi:4-hydroxybenzoate polyprenyltransferase
MDVLAYFKHIRWREIVLLLGSPVLAVFLSLRLWSDFDIDRFVLFCLATAFLLAQVYLFNDWVGLKNRQSLMFSLAIGALGLWLHFVISPSSFLIALAIVGLGIVYSLKFKGVALVCSLIHLAGGILLFLLGYGLFSLLDWRGLALSLFFAMVYCAGHLVHELIDAASDSASGLRTNAVTFGKGNTFIASVILFIFSWLYLVFLAARGFISFPLMYAAVILGPLDSKLFLRTWQKGLSREELISLRRDYRRLYILLGVYIWFTALWTII